MMKKIIQSLCGFLFSTIIVYASDQDENYRHLTHLHIFDSGTENTNSRFIPWHESIEVLARYKNL